MEFELKTAQLCNFPSLWPNQCLDQQTGNFLHKFRNVLLLFFPTFFHKIWHKVQRKPQSRY